MFMFLLTVPTCGLVIMFGKLSVIYNFSPIVKNKSKLDASNFCYYKMSDQSSTGSELAALKILLCWFFLF